MARVHPFQSNFTAGELSPRLEGQIDFKKYFNGCSELTNMVVYPHGGATRRGGTHFVSEVKDSTKEVRLIPFEFNITQSYVLEFGDQYIRFYKDNGQISTTPNSVLEVLMSASGDNYTTVPTVGFTGGGGTGATATATLAVESITKTASGAGYTEVPTIKFSGGAGSAASATLDLAVDDLTITDGGTGYSIAPTIVITALDVDDTGSGATATCTINGAGKIDAITITNAGTGYTEIPEITIAGACDTPAVLDPTMKIDTVTLTNGGHDYTTPPTVTFEGGDTSTIAEATITMGVDAVSVTAIGSGYTSVPTVTFTGGAGTGATATSTVSGTDGIYEITTPYLETDLFELHISQSADVMYICHSAHAPRKLSRTGHTSWSLSQPDFTWATTSPWNDANGYPRTVTFYEQRLFFAGTSASPQTIWGSQTADYENFDQGTGLADQSMEYAIATNRVNVIRWMQPSRDLIVGTGGGEFKVGRPQGEPLTPSNVMVTQQTTYGSWTIPPLQVGNSILFAQRARRKLREFSYQYQDNGYIAPDMTLLAEHITSGYLKDMDYQQEPDSIVWSCTADGKLLSMTYERPEDVVAWAGHEVGGTDSKVESLTVITNTTQDQLWVLVQRTINGSSVRYVEYLDPDINVDSGITGTVSTATTSVSGLSHLEGETVNVVINDAVFPDKTVSSGSITISVPTGWSNVAIEVGLNFTSTLKTMRVEAGSQAGKAQGLKKRWNEVKVRLLNTTGVKINGDQLPFRTSADLMSAGVGLFTGDKRVTNLGWDRDGIIEIKQEQPLPLTVLGIHGTLTVSD